MVWIPLVTCCSCCRSCPNWAKILPRNNWFPCSPGLKAFPSIVNSNNFNRFELLMGALFFIPHGGFWSAYALKQNERLPIMQSFVLLSAHEIDFTTFENALVPP